MRAGPVVRAVIPLGFVPAMQAVGFRVGAVYRRVGPFCLWLADAPLCMRRRRSSWSRWRTRGTVCMRRRRRGRSGCPGCCCYRSGAKVSGLPVFNTESDDPRELTNVVCDEYQPVRLGYRCYE